ncbi:substrate-binding domain-containing protein [Kyrpidia spormannii]|uniref:Phosphate-binding protein PstS n=2 Tax=Kyrpidia spormannii TaxID=2055160 RepID=A0ACA8ZCX1_9BACL
MLRRLVALMASVFLGLVWVVGCGGSGAGSGSAGAPLPRSGGKTVLLNGAGATFPYPLYSRWMDEYSRLTPNVRINYQSIGSGGGIE